MLGWPSCFGAGYAGGASEAAAPARRGGQSSFSEVEHLALPPLQDVLRQLFVEVDSRLQVPASCIY